MSGRTLKVPIDCRMPEKDLRVGLLTGILAVFYWKFDFGVEFVGRWRSCARSVASQAWSNLGNAFASDNSLVEGC